MADEVDATFEVDVAEVDHEWDGEWRTLGSAISARDDGEVGMVVDMVRERNVKQQFKGGARTPPHRDLLI